MHIVVIINMISTELFLLFDHTILLTFAYANRTHANVFYKNFVVGILSLYDRDNQMMHPGMSSTCRSYALKDKSFQILLHTRGFIWDIGGLFHHSRFFEMYHVY